MKIAESTTAAALAALLSACGPGTEPSAPALAAATTPEASAGAADQPAPSQDRVAALEGELQQERRARQALEAERDELRAERARLLGELEVEAELRLEREREWLRYTKALRSLELASLPDDVEFVPAVGDDEPAPQPPVEDPAAIAARERAAQIARSLTSLLNVELVSGLTLLESGSLGPGWTGPVVFRLNDTRGRLAGSLYAERLRLEGSRTARTLTLVFEDGYEMRGGERAAFAHVDSELDGAPRVRRLVLPHVDPQPWMEALPELFGGSPLEEPVDDGLWNLMLVRGELNIRLREDASGGSYRLRELGGVQAGVLREVHLEVFDSEGLVDRHLFADRLSVVLTEGGVLLLLEDGAQVRGEQKAPFLEGRYRIYLPRARHQDWIEARIPGLTHPDGRKLSTEEPESARETNDG